MKFIHNISNYIKINEASIKSFDSSNILTDEYIKKFIKDDDFCESMVENFIYDTNMVDGDDLDLEDIANSDNFFNYLKKKISESLEIFKHDMTYLISAGYIDIYRVMRVSDKWIDHIKTDGKRLGEYWTYDENSAEAHWGNNLPNYVKIMTTVKEEYVDWETSFEMNMHPKYSTENEIRLYKNTPIKILSLNFNGKNINFPEGKLYRA